MSNKDNGTLNWDDFRKLGNPENAPELPPEPTPKKKGKEAEMKLRVHLEKKGRGGKWTSIIRGWTGFPSELATLGKELKVKCGVGGSVKNNEIIIQGDKRDKIMEILAEKGYKQAKKAGG